MAKIVVENPDLHETKNVDDQGRVYLGTDFKGKKVEIVVEILEEE